METILKSENNNEPIRNNGGNDVLIFVFLAWSKNQSKTPIEIKIMAKKNFALAFTVFEDLRLKI